ncbi:MAG: L,D-transpeptidase/peptidoglycan binding protein [Solirubrobacteraceae bacterium]|nr:L,D-transpeptidase/peptidoglycan binding protein [Solirubrobacteraceae bacterium]
MRTRAFIISAGTLVALLLVVGGVMVADASGGDRIPSGVTIGTVDVGGMTRDEAITTVRRHVDEHHARTIRVVHSDKEWKLTPRQAKVEVDVEATVDRAMDLADDGNAFTRVFRRITGGSVDKRLTTTTTFSKPAVSRLMDRVAADLKREPQNASVTFEDGKLRVKKGLPGLRLKRGDVSVAVRKAIVDPSLSPQISAHTHKKQPEVSTADVRKRYGTVLVANRATFKLTLYKKLKPVKTYGISVGKAGNDTPAGQYTIANKAENPAWHVPNSAWAGSLAGTVVPPGPSNPLKARWMGIYDGVGIHGTADDASIGTNASHGCLRMHVPDVIELYDRVPVGTPIWIL